MAKYTIECQCGHEIEKNIVGKVADRQSKADYFAQGLCPECWKKEQEEKRAAENKAAAEKNTEAGLPALEGSEKQIAWAETIRSSKITEIEENAEKYGMNEKGMAVFAALKTENQSKFWIDNRNKTILQILQNVKI